MQRWQRAQNASNLEVRGVERVHNTLIKIPFLDVFHALFSVVTSMPLGVLVIEEDANCWNMTLKTQVGGKSLVGTQPIQSPTAKAHTNHGSVN